ncbi:MAG TPA: EF-hand domain-containing protein [Stenotrophomonas sp.]|nr:EF-hand domain-containing protein [Stenotrophomonas sp.]
MTFRKPLIVLAVLAALSSASAFAVDTPPSDGGQRGLSRLDSNGDGVIDRAEAAKAPRLAQNFDTLDKNKDGKLSRDELPKRAEFHRGAHEHMTKLDTNKDGRISREEAKADPKFASRFDKLDVNKDGYVDKADFQARRQQSRDAWFAAADTDKDGKLSKAEFDAAASKRAPFGHGMHGGPRGGHDHGKAPTAAKPAATQPASTTQPAATK